MANMINTNYFAQYQSTALFGKQNSAANTQVAADKNLLESYGATVELSDEGINALKTDEANVSAESKLSDKAKNFLANLREKYGDYDFMISDSPNAADTFGNTKAYSVIFTPEELEKMADDDDYAQKVMGQVGNAVDMLKDLSEKDLGEGVQFSQLSVSIDDEGNMKLFAQLEKLSAEQQERLDAAKERRAEEQKNQEAEESDAEPELTKILFKGADIEADSAEELLSKIFGIDWDEIAEEEAYI